MSELPPATTAPRGLDAQSGDVRIISVFGVIFGTLGLSCLPFNFGAWITYGWPIEGSKASPVEMWVFASTFVGLGLSALLLLSSLASMRFLWWGRDGLILWACASLLYGIAGIYFWGRFFLPWLNYQYVAMRGPDEVAGLLAWMIGSIFAIFVLWYLTRPSVKAAFVH